MMENRRRARFAAFWEAHDAKVHKYVADVAKRIEGLQKAIAECERRKQAVFERATQQGRKVLTQEELFHLVANDQDIRSHRDQVVKAESEVQGWVSYRETMLMKREQGSVFKSAKEQEKMTKELEAAALNPAAAMAQLREVAKTQARTRARVEKMHEEKKITDEMAAEMGVQDGMLILPAPPMSPAATHALDNEVKEGEEEMEGTKEARRNEEVNAMFQAIQLEFQMQALPAPPAAVPLVVSPKLPKKVKKASSSRKQHHHPYQELEQEQL
jgi:hypothetical protein